MIVIDKTITKQARIKGNISLKHTEKYFGTPQLSIQVKKIKQNRKK